MKECLLFTEKWFVFEYCLIFIVLGQDTSSQCCRDRPNGGSRPDVKERRPIVCHRQGGNKSLCETKTIKY
jgi:hypothetical protein